MREARFERTWPPRFGAVMTLWIFIEPLTQTPKVIPDCGGKMASICLVANRFVLSEEARSQNVTLGEEL
jgi:hypothetical protein